MLSNHGLIIHAHVVELGCQKDRDLCQPSMIVEDRSKGLQGFDGAAMQRPPPLLAGKIARTVVGTRKLASTWASRYAPRSPVRGRRTERHALAEELQTPLLPIADADEHAEGKR